MCGLTGYLEPGGVDGERATRQAEAMAHAIVHRGPDSSGVWVDPEAGLALAHRRLAILDLSPAGHQPMSSTSGRFVLAFNGEIYNHLELRRALESAGSAPDWRGHSDTETLLAAFEEWGIEDTLCRSVGMFAIALWDRKERALVLVRDRMGEKPLFYGWQGGSFMFGSELRALERHSKFERELDRGAVHDLIRFGYVTAGRSIYRGIHRLPPGTFVRIGSGTRIGALPEPTAYWSLEELARDGRDQLGLSPREAIDRLDDLILDAVGGQMLSDVPLGAFLSGGIDSSTIVAAMQRRSARPVRTFTIGFEESGYDEAGYAREVAGHLGTDHTELYVTAERARDVIPRLTQIYDEPFGDSSSIPTRLVAALAREHVTVSLSGDGGDELFAGYTRYHSDRSADLWRRMRAIPGPIRSLTTGILRSPLPRWADRLTGGRTGGALRATKLAAIAEAGRPIDAYRARISQWNDVPILRLHEASEFGSQVPSPHPEMMMFADAMTYLPDDILVKVDRAAMSVSLETRVPLLDHRIVEFAWALPHDIRVRAGQAKWLLRQVLYRSLPPGLVDRPKMGFGVPLGRWLRGPLRPWAEELLSEAGLRDGGVLDAGPIRRLWLEHQRGHADHRDRLWPILMFQAWASRPTPPGRVE